MFDRFLRRCYVSLLFDHVEIPPSFGLSRSSSIHAITSPSKGVDSIFCWKAREGEGVPAPVLESLGVDGSIEVASSMQPSVILVGKR
ncbi:hypothetical protein F2Q69_00011627 [Brassica cretica]|uniref:Uncharacterized protein n=1 Tax=Brassica cretica TaxID=69181 RepID=A0A8S9QPL5_BRACR|nr:hypothetical protein F2Q69_00011627 [Brassica cretica]